MKEKRKGLLYFRKSIHMGKIKNSFMINSFAKYNFIFTDNK